MNLQYLLGLLLFVLTLLSSGDALSLSDASMLHHVRSLSVHNNGVNLRPIIGILAQPLSNDFPNEMLNDSNRHSYIAASYVKYLEMAGARVVPIPYDLPEARLQPLLASLNGVLFPGGGTPLDETPYLKTHRRIMQFAMEMKDRHGIHYPLWATCLGFEAVVIVTSKQGYPVMYNHFDSWNISMPLNMMPDAKESTLFRDMTPQLYEAIQKEAITMNNHHSGFRTKDFMDDSSLTSFWRVLSLNDDRKKVEFISTIEARNYPIYAVQWHPEKNVFEWTIREGIDHSFEGMLMAQYFANFFVQEARKNPLKFSNAADENAALIYNYAPEFTYLRGSDFQQCYYFEKSP